MASIRWTIMEALRDRLATLGGWTASMRRDVEARGNSLVRATIWHVGEENTFANATDYDVQLEVLVEIEARAADADDTLDGDGSAGSANPYSYLDRMVVEAEKLIHTPDTWGLQPAFTDVRVTGHDVAGPEDGEELHTVAALLRLTFRYRRSIEDPTK